MAHSDEVIPTVALRREGVRDLEPAVEPLGARQRPRAGDEGRVVVHAQKLDARAWLLIRGWVDPVVRVRLTDPKDPTPYWLVSSRHPEAVVAALEEPRQRTPGK